MSAAQHTPGPTNIGWFTTEPHPFKKAHTHGADDGQIGWRLHAVPVNEVGQPEDKAAPLCGQRPRHGWGMDLFIDDECARCTRAMGKREAAGETFVDLPKKRTEERKAAWQDGAQAAHVGEPRSSNPYSEPHTQSEWLRGFDEICAEDTAIAKATGQEGGA